MNVVKQLSLLLVALLSFPHRLGAHSQPATANTRLMEKVLSIPQGHPVDIRLKTRETIHGRLGQVSQQSFHVQYVKGDKVVDREITYLQVKSIRQTNRESPDSKSLGWSIVAVLAGIAVSVAIVAAKGH